MAIITSHQTGRSDLVGAFMENAQLREAFVAEQVFPVVPVNRSAANFPNIPRESNTQLIDNPMRGVDGEYASMTFKTEDLSYKCHEYGMKIPLDDSQITELSNDFNIDVTTIAGQILFEQILMQLELRVAAQAFDAVTNFTAGNGNFSDFSGSAPWTTTTSAIVSSIQTASEAIIAATGLLPTDMVINYTNLIRLLQNSTLASKLATTRDQTVAELTKMIAPLLGLERVHVGKRFYNGTAGMGAYAGTKFWSNLYALVFVGNPSGDLFSPRLGVTLLYQPDSPDLVVLEEYRDDRVRGNVMRSRSKTDELVLDVQYGHLLQIAAS